MRSVVVAVGFGLLACACGEQRPAIDPPLVSGVTSSNGGGQRSTGAIPNFTVGPNGGRVTNGVPSDRGAAY